MHELAVTEGLLNLALEHAQAAGGGRITALYLVVGELSSMVDESVQFYWDLLSAGTAAQGARLHFERVAAELECRACGRRYQPTPDELACPACAACDVSIVAGEEFYLDALDLEPVCPGESKLPNGS